MTPLRQRMLEDMQVRNLAPRTQCSYVEHVSRFARHYGRSPAVLGPAQIRAYQLYLTQEKHLAPASIVVAVAALRFLYTVTLQKAWALARSASRDLAVRPRLGYLPSPLVRDGRWHSISVRVPGKDVRVRTRSGYYAPRSVVRSER